MFWYTLFNANNEKFVIITPNVKHNIFLLIETPIYIHAFMEPIIYKNRRYLLKFLYVT